MGGSDGGVGVGELCVVCKCICVRMVMVVVIGMWVDGVPFVISGDDYGSLRAHSLVRSFTLQSFPI